MGFAERDAWLTERKQNFARMEELGKRANGAPLAEGTEDYKNFVAANDRINELDKLIEQDLKVDERKKQQAEFEERSRAFDASVIDPSFVNGTPIPGNGKEDRGQKTDAELRAAASELAFRHYIAGGREAYNNLAPEVRAMTAGDFVSGGAITVPKAVMMEIIKDAEGLFPLKALVNQLPKLEKAESLGRRILATRLPKYEKVGENQTPTSQGLTFTQRELTPHGFAMLVPFSGLLAQRADTNVESMIKGEFGYAGENTKDYYILNGSGANEPLGLMTASTLGVTTSQDVAFTSASAVDFDAPLKAIYKVPAAFRAGSSFVFHSDTVLKFRLLKTATEGLYHWQEKVSAGEPERLHNYPVIHADNMPSTVSASAYLGIFGNFNLAYEFVEAWQSEMQVLNELYALSNEIAILHRIYFDGMPVRPTAVARLQLAAS